MENKTKIKWAKSILDKTYDETNELSKDGLETAVKAACGEFEHLTYTVTQNLREYVETMGECMTCTRGRYPKYKYVKTKEECIKQIELLDLKRFGRTVSAIGDPTKNLNNIFDTLKFIYMCDSAIVTYDTLRENGHFEPSKAWVERINSACEKMSAPVGLTITSTHIDVKDRKGKTVSKYVTGVMKDSKKLLHAMQVIAAELKKAGIELECPSRVLIGEHIETVPETLSYKDRILRYEERELAPGFGDLNTRLALSEQFVRQEMRERGEDLPEVLYTPKTTFTVQVSLEKADRLMKTAPESKMWFGDETAIVTVVASKNKLADIAEIINETELIKLVPEDNKELIDTLSKYSAMAAKKAEYKSKLDDLLKKREDMDFAILELEEKLKEME